MGPIGHSPDGWWFLAHPEGLTADRYLFLDAKTGAVVIQAPRKREECWPVFAPDGET
jgi:hypothetical protein